ncbi:MAG: dockerin type I domain-containing protein [Clostridium sp.]|nr:dockerin type I domain-containing protein [Clostridium sp.]MCM1547710.1 dockerin type I domain-containing protein [Ruminococcus sp.]
MSKLLKKISSAFIAASMIVTTASAIPSVTAADTDGESDVIFESEAEKLQEGVQVWTSIYENQIPGYSGEGFIYITGDSVKFEVEAPEDGMYQLNVKYAQILSEDGRLQTIAVNGSEYSSVLPYSNEWKDYNFGMFRLKKGTNNFEIMNKYGYAAFDTITIKKADFPELKVSPVLSDKKATKETQGLMNYLCDMYGSSIISGQQTIYGGGHTMTTTIRYDVASDSCVDDKGNKYAFDEADKAIADDGSTFVWKCVGNDGQVYSYNQQNRNYTYCEYDRELKYVRDTFGDMPAIQGFDFGANCPCYAWDDGIVERMIDWTNNKNGICTASWHINVPTALADYTLGEPLDFSKTTYSEKCDFSPSNAYTEGTIEYEYFQLCIANLAEQLSKLQEAGVPVIFRPLHEADGNYSNGGVSWFWWGKEGPEVYNNLWKFLKNELEEKYDIHNLIWEQNLYAWSDASAEWYTGDDYVDMVGYDKYNTEYNRHDGKTSGPNLDAESGIFWKLNEFVNGNKMVTLPETSTVPSLDNMQIENAGWGYFCPWYDEESSPKFISGDDYQDLEELKKLYQSDYCITLSELPADWKNYESGTVIEKPTNPTDPNGNEIIPGDLNGDKAVNVIDSTLFRRWILTNDGAPTGFPPSIYAADTNGDGSPYNIADLVLLNEYILGKDVELTYYKGKIYN